MNTELEKDIFCLVILGICVISAMAGSMIGRKNGIDVMQKQAIQQKVARYNPDTAKFEWTQPVENNNE